MIQAGLDIMFYSGDADSQVPGVGSIKWIQTLNSQYNYQTIIPTQAWNLQGNYLNQTQVAGYWAQYESLRYVQVKGSGHEVPYYNPPAAWKLLYTFLNKQLLS